MIVTQTPLRISLAGGGTDLAHFWREEPGMVVSTAIDKYVFAVIKRRFDNLVRVGYTKTELVATIDEIEHDLVREAARQIDVGPGWELSTMADVPAAGSGLGSSASVTIGVMHALCAYVGRLVTAEELASQACRIEIDVLGRPVGKQDQYIVAYGGLRVIEFGCDGTVTTETIKMPMDARLRLEDNLLLFYTGLTRDASGILAEHVRRGHQNMGNLRRIRDQARELRCALERGEISAAGEVLREGWERKKALGGAVSSPAIDAMYERAVKAGALGGKVPGAGGGGFLLLYCPEGTRESVRAALADYRELPFRFEPDGSKAVFNARR
ncbi:MAG TPA: GHMP kinase [Armatimonadota bacterium]|nr:GHMP kinase [Armatimonadota bacterium]